LSGGLIIQFIRVIIDELINGSSLEYIGLSNNEQLKLSINKINVPSVNNLKNNNILLSNKDTNMPDINQGMSESNVSSDSDVPSYSSLYDKKNKTIREEILPRPDLNKPQLSLSYLDMGVIKVPVYTLPSNEVYYGTSKEHCPPVLKKNLPDGTEIRPLFYKFSMIGTQTYIVPQGVPYVDTVTGYKVKILASDPLHPSFSKSIFDLKYRSSNPQVMVPRYLSPPLPQYEYYKERLAYFEDLKKRSAESYRDHLGFPEITNYYYSHILYCNSQLEDVKFYRDVHLTRPHNKKAFDEAGISIPKKIFEKDS
jgi:hypothetical protein